MARLIMALICQGYQPTAATAGNGAPLLIPGHDHFGTLGGMLCGTSKAAGSTTPTVTHLVHAGVQELVGAA